jgi:hypothetical protein
MHGITHIKIKKYVVFFTEVVPGCEIMCLGRKEPMHDVMRVILWVGTCVKRLALCLDTYLSTQHHIQGHHTLQFATIIA